MAKRIKVTGYLDPEEMASDHVDLSHEMGLSSEGYEALTGYGPEGLGLEDIEFELEDD